MIQDPGWDRAVTAQRLTSYQNKKTMNHECPLNQNKAQVINSELEGNVSLSSEVSNSISQ